MRFHKNRILFFTIAVFGTTTTSTNGLQFLFGPPRRSSLVRSPSIAEKAFSMLQQRRQLQSLSPRTTKISSSSASSIDSSSSSSSESQQPQTAPDGETTSVVAAATTTTTTPSRRLNRLRPWQSMLTRIGMMMYIAAMCVALPLTLVPQKLLYKMGFLTRAEKEHLALRTGQFCARWLLRLIPFCKITKFGSHHPNPPESVWVCNHQSMLDVFVMLAADVELRGKNRRPIRVIYWKQLEKNPVSKLLFRQAGFIPVQMSDNGSGTNNDYDKRSFKQLLKDAKQAFEDGFDIGVLPEGQLNPTPERGLLPVFSGAYTLAKMSKRPVQMMSLAGVHDLWHPVHGMHCIGRHIQIRAYPYMFRFAAASDFIAVFNAIVGHFAMHGVDLPEQEGNALVAENLLLKK